MHCHYAAAMFLLPTGLVFSVAQHHEGEERLPSSVLC